MLRYFSFFFLLTCVAPRWIWKKNSHQNTNCLLFSYIFTLFERLFHLCFFFLFYSASNEHEKKPKWNFSSSESQFFHCFVKLLFLTFLPPFFCICHCYLAAVFFSFLSSHFVRSVEEKTLIMLNYAVCTLITVSVAHLPICWTNIGEQLGRKKPLKIACSFCAWARSIWK